MFIKQVIIQGFKSYRDQTIADPFNSKHNVIVGRNGSGKSNFFFAICFVLSDKYSNMRQEERKALLHEGPGPQVMSAFVEIIFDNSDNRLPIDKEEVSIRRVIGVKKDEFLIDKKHMTKTDVFNLFETAGFSKSNPYYIVRQGRVNALTMMKDSARLELLKEVAGTRVYDDRRMESMKTLEETQSRRQKIEEYLGYIEERLQHLEEEKEELREYQQLDREKRSLEYTLYDQELQQARDKLQLIEQTKEDETRRASERNEEFQTASDLVKACERDIKALNNEIENLTGERSALESGAQDVISAKADLESEVSDLKQKLKEATESHSLLESSMSQLQDQIERNQKLLEEAKSTFQTEEDNWTTTTRELNECKARLNALYSKEGRKTQFKSRADRDNWLREQIRKTEKDVAARQTEVGQIKKEIAKFQKESKNLANDLKKKEDERAQREKAREEMLDKRSQLIESRDENQNRRKELWGREKQIEKELTNCDQDLRRCENQLAYATPKVIHAGLATVKSIVSKHKIPGVYGPVLELFDVEDQFATAVEVTAKSSLFHVVVDTDETVSKILAHMKHDKGRVTFMPLNRLSPKEKQFPDSSDVTPMISKLSFKPAFKRAFLQIFGKTLICRNLEIAAKFSRECGFNCVTLEGDQVSKRGALTGGYSDIKSSKLEVMRNLKHFRNTRNELQAEVQETQTELQKLDQAITAAVGELQKNQAKDAHLQETAEVIKMDQNSVKERLDSKEDAINQKKQLLARADLDLGEVMGRLAGMQEELNSEFNSRLSDVERKELTALNEKESQLTKSLAEIETVRAQAESQKANIQDLLQSNLQKQMNEMEQQITKLDIEGKQQTLQEKERQLDGVMKSGASDLKQRDEIEGDIEGKKTQVKTLSSKLEKLRQDEKVASRAMHEEGKTVEKLLSKRTVLLKKKEENLKKIRDLGTLPAETFEKFKNVKHGELLKRLERCNKNLAKYSHVNKKALDQYVNFTEQRDKLHKRKEEIDTGANAIKDLIRHLDLKKDEAIGRTFKGVAKSFAAVFKELVPQGKASLVMQKRLPGEQDEDDEEEHSSKRQRTEEGQISAYTGVSVRVSFTGSGDAHLMAQLSGGQKSLVALALIFAIQRCDPAPFYLFDEIDAALDANHRAAVADMIGRQSEYAQFITTTFRPEFLNTANHFYGVTYRNKVSHINSVTKSQATEFVYAEQQHG